MQDFQPVVESSQPIKKVSWVWVFGTFCVLQLIAIGYLIAKLPSSSTVSLPSATPLVNNKTEINEEEFAIEIKKIGQKNYCIQRESQSGETILIGEIIEGSDTCQHIPDTRISGLLQKAAPTMVNDFWIDEENLITYFLSEGPQIGSHGKYILTTASYMDDTGGIDYSVQTLPFGGPYTTTSIIAAQVDTIAFSTGGGDGCGGSSNYFTYSISKKMKVNDILSYSYDCDSVKFTSKVGMKNNLIWFIDSELREGREGPATYTTLFSIDPFTADKKTIFTDFSETFPNLYIAESVPPKISNQLNENEVVVTDLATRGQYANANWSAVDVQTKNVRKLQ